MTDDRRLPGLAQMPAHEQPRTEQKPRILVTNDDGIDAPGIRWLARAACEFSGEVTIAAPHQETSGFSAALTASTEAGRLDFTRVTLNGLPDVPTYSVAASPGYIAVLANLGSFGPPPEILLSGINRGANAGHAVLHSGTVGAAFTAANGGARAMAVSLDVLSAAAGTSASGGAAIATLDTIDDETRNWATAAAYAKRLLTVLLDLPSRSVLNLNVPDIPEKEVRGVRQALLAPFGQVQLAISEHG